MKTQKTVVTKDYSVADAPTTYTLNEAMAWADGAEHGYAEGYKAAIAELVAVAKIIRNSAGQITMKDASGDYFDMSKYVGSTLYTQNPTNTGVFTQAELDEAEEMIANRPSRNT